MDAEDLQPLQEDNSNALILPASRKRSAPDAATDPDDAPSSTGPLTKAQKRKLRRIAEEKAARAQRAHALAMIQSHALDAQAAGLMQRTAKRGQRSTVKESLKRDLALQRAGLPLPRGSRLLRQRTVGGEGDGMGEEDGMGSEEEEEQEVCGGVLFYAITVPWLCGVCIIFVWLSRYPMYNIPTSSSAQHSWLHIDTPPTQVSRMMITRMMTMRMMTSMIRLMIRTRTNHLLVLQPPVPIIM